MTAPRKRSRRLVALPLGMAMATAFAFLPSITASAAEAAPKASAADAATLSYVVNIPTGQGPSATVKKAIADAGGTITIAYDQIGVIVVHSSNPDFARTIRKVPGVQSAGATRTAPLATQSTTDIGVTKELTAEEVANAQAADGQDPLESLQWDLPAIKADKAHEKTLGSHDVTVAVIDTGVDDTHPDLAPNFNRDASVNCVSGKPNTADGAWRPSATESNHGTHVAGEIAAAKNGIGMTGVAPGVQVAGIKVSNPDGYFYTEAVVCGFVWAAEHHVDVTNNSYYTDPWNFNCLDDADQKALVDAITRASQYAEHKGTVNVAAAGNENYDLDADSITDPVSPNDGASGDRVIDPHKCFDIPTQLPGVVTVAATGAKGIKSSFSNYGLNVIDVAAPGGDSTAYQPPAAPATSGLILGTLPGGKWGYKAGTSMASPHVAGVAALIKSTHPNATAGQVKALLYSQADATPCTDPYDINSDGKIDAVCLGSKNHNGFYGAGIVNALNAVTK
ncbi:S8 family serine peptidase [Streptomyces colonosanans]|uniref:Peptidase S8 n=1 Tax=Streptomyces colonosanans TaxID=1428652 RepID=A0A1S2P0F2_9ACTN|nr:S8 family serine peptidase [Streptomyces colonosanans]OIJ87230.1 peptidase S8 [Streptomyces colonosanans]